MPRFTIDAVGSKARCGSDVLISNERSTTSVSVRAWSWPDAGVAPKARQRRRAQGRRRGWPSCGRRIGMELSFLEGSGAFEPTARSRARERASRSDEGGPAAPGPLQPARHGAGRLRPARAAAPRTAALEARTGSVDGSGSRSAVGPGRAPRPAAPRASCPRRLRGAPRRSAPRCTGGAAAPTALRRRSSTICPRYMTATVWATWRTIARSCEMRSRPSSSSLASRTRRFAICACAEASSEAERLVEDDHGRVRASARAIAMRWRWPPENWCG